jgi:hypothetical protein
MLRDVFYYGSKPNAHAREKHAIDLADARQQCTTEHFWIINEYCNYTNFDWDWDFDFLPDEEVWTSEHNNVWPNNLHKDSGTWLCSKNYSDIIIYRADVEPIHRKNIKNDNWILLDKIDELKFDFSWEPNPYDPPYIYRWGCKFYPIEIKHYVEYHVEGATNVKYMPDIVELIPEWDNWVEVQAVDKSSFDFSWRPDPREPAYIYTWGNKYIDSTLKPTLEYHMEGATERKYMDNSVSVLPEWDNWKEIQLVDKLSFDFSWRPDPQEPAYIYTWGNKYISAELKPTLEYHVKGAIERKYMDNSVGVLPEWDKWKTNFSIDKTTFDFSWRPDPREPAYIYAFGNTQYLAEIMPTVEYRVPGATEFKFIEDESMRAKLLPNSTRFQHLENCDGIDYSWHPDPWSPPYIYAWGNQWNKPEDKISIQYVVDGATEYKYMEERATRKPCMDNWEIPPYVIKNSFDYSWEPNPHDPPYIYQFGTVHQKTGGPRYVVPGATEIKYIDTLKAEVVAWRFTNWLIPRNVDQKSFDFSWHPDDTEPAYIYQFPSTWSKTGGPKFTVEGATETKYLDYPIAKVKQDMTHWTVPKGLDTSEFDFSWHPDVNDEPLVYQFGTQWQKTDGPIFTPPSCNENTPVKYMDLFKAKRLANDINWDISADIEEFDYSWHPDSTEPAYIYQFPSTWNKVGGPRYVATGATDIKYMDYPVAKLKPNMTNWSVPDGLDTIDFDFTWHPDVNDEPLVYQFGTQWQKTNGPVYTAPGSTVDTPVKYMDITKAKRLPDKTNWDIPVDIKEFDYSWHPDDTEPAFIYQFSSAWSKTGGPRYIVNNASEIKYIDSPVAKLKPNMTHWSIPDGLDTSEFDFSWHPDMVDAPLIYQFGTQWQKTNGPVYTAPGSTVDTPVKYMDITKAKRLPNKTNWITPKGFDDTNFDFTWHPDTTSPPYIYQFGTLLEDIHLRDGPKYVTPGNDGHVVLLENILLSDKNIVYPQYYIETTLNVLIEDHKDEIFWALRKNIDYTTFDFTWRPTKEQVFNINTFGSPDSETTQTYLVNGKMWQQGYKDISFIENTKLDEEYLSKLFKQVDAFFVDKGNKESAIRFEQLKLQFPTLQKTRYLNSWVDTINRCINKSTTELCWILNSELDYTNFDFNYYPNPWQMTMVHVFGTQWSHWGSTFMVNKETFAEDTKYVKIIEHLSNLNFVKTKRAVASNCLYDVYLIDYGNDGVNDIVSLIESKTKRENVYTIKYETDYLTTLKNMLYELGIKKDHYIWVCSSICDYTNFDFTYICDPFSLEQLHVFPSDKQKFGDTFFINVNKLRILVEDLDKLESIEKINFNQHQKVKRLPAPSFVTDADTHLNFKKHSYNFPYAVFTTSDNLIAPDINDEPISMWSSESKNILITNMGGTRIVVPKEANDYVEKELYDYPYIAKSTNIGQSKPLDIVFLSNGEAIADENYEHLLNVTKGLKNRVVRVDGVNGRVAAYHAAALASQTSWMFTVFAKLKVNSKFDFSWQPDRLQIPKHYIFYASNPVNGLVYGHQAMIAYNKQITLGNMGKGLDFTLDSEHEVVEINSGVAHYNTDEFSTWRTSFREVIKLRLDDSTISRHRLKVWTTVGEGDYAQYSINGALDAVEYYESVNGELDKLRLSYDWPWLQLYFNTKYN